MQSRCPNCRRCRSSSGSASSAQPRPDRLGRDQSIFEIRSLLRTSTPSPLLIDMPFVWNFGELPLQIWQAPTRFNVWIEPFSFEWVRLIEGYAGTEQTNVRLPAHSLLAWADPERDARIARDVVARMRAATSEDIRNQWPPRRRRAN